MIADDLRGSEREENGRTAHVARPKMAWYWFNRSMVPREGRMDSKGQRCSGRNRPLLQLNGPPVAFCWYDYILLGPMFFHAVIGFEAMLRVHYQVGVSDAFRTLLEKAVREGVITDHAFSGIQPLPKLLKEKIDPGLVTHADRWPHYCQDSGTTTSMVPFYSLRSCCTWRLRCAKWPTDSRCRASRR